MPEPLLDWILNLDVGVAGVVIVYLYNETVRLRKELVEEREERQELSENYIEYVQTQAKKWGDLVATMRTTRERLKEANGD